MEKWLGDRRDFLKLAGAGTVGTGVGLAIGLVIGSRRPPVDTEPSIIHQVSPQTLSPGHEADILAVTRRKERDILTAAQRAINAGYFAETNPDIEYDNLRSDQYKVLGALYDRFLYVEGGILVSRAGLVQPFSVTNSYEGDLLRRSWIETENGSGNRMLKVLGNGVRLEGRQFGEDTSDEELVELATSTFSIPGDLDWNNSDFQLGMGQWKAYRKVDAQFQVGDTLSRVIVGVDINEGRWSKPFAIMSLTYPS